MTETLTGAAMDAMQEHSPARSIEMWWSEEMTRPVSLAKGEKLPPEASSVIMSDGSYWDLFDGKWTRRGGSRPWEGVVGGKLGDIVSYVGDITSQERGTGTRFNAGKTPYQFIPFGVLASMLEMQVRHYQGEAPEDLVTLSYIITHLADFQEGDDSAIHEALLCCWSDLDSCARVFEYGASKYAEWNWLKGMKWSVIFGCIWRHAMAIVESEKTDPESGLPHMGHLICNVVMLAQFVESYPEGDDRPPAKFFNGASAED